VGIELLCRDPVPTLNFDKEPDQQFFNTPAGKPLNIYLLQLEIYCPILHCNTNDALGIQGAGTDTEINVQSWRKITYL
jgi:hypothetical protein